MSTPKSQEGSRWPQEEHADLGLLDDDRTEDLRLGLRPDES